MNYFFNIKNKLFSSEIQIPTFQNNGTTSKSINLYKCWPKNDCWIVEKIEKKEEEPPFYYISCNENTNSEIYFLAHQEELFNYDNLKLKNFNNFTDTSPSYRANLKIFMNINTGFSSYQSEYPYSMASKKGTILSSVCSLGNKNAEKNFIFIKNIYEKPTIEYFDAYLVNIKTQHIEEKFQIKTNYTNCIELDQKLIKPEIFLVTKDYLGIPIYASLKDQHLSFEHTHPPHESILSENKFTKVAELKKEINEIIN